MRLYLDTEFNGHGGELISLALVADSGDEFYGIYDTPKNPHPWVQEHVMPYLLWGGHSEGSPPMYPSKQAFMAAFALFAYRFRDAEVIADWPADIEHMCRLLSWNGSENGWRVPANFRFRLIDREHNYVSECEHNALSDARALRDYCNDWKI